MYEYIVANLATIIKNIDVTFRNTTERQRRIDGFLEREKERIYRNDMDFTSGCSSDHWMEASFDMVVAVLAFGVPFGYYNTGLGWSSFAAIKNDTELNVSTFDRIIIPPVGCQIIVYNGTNHFKYLNCNMSPERNLPVNKSRGVICPKEETVDLLQIEAFEPDLSMLLLNT